jgi:hypothetical protein
MRSGLQVRTVRLAIEVIIALLNIVRVFLHHHVDIVVWIVQSSARCCGYTRRIPWPAELKVCVPYCYGATLAHTSSFYILDRET